MPKGGISTPHALIFIIKDIPKDELKKIMIASKNMTALYKYLNINKEMSMKINEKTKPPPPPGRKVYVIMLKLDLIISFYQSY